jgi:hypothetical protein
MGEKCWEQAKERRGGGKGSSAACVCCYHLSLSDLCDGVISGGKHLAGREGGECDGE